MNEVLILIYRLLSISVYFVLAYIIVSIFTYRSGRLYEFLAQFVEPILEPFRQLSQKLFPNTMLDLGAIFYYLFVMILQLLISNIIKR